MIELFDAARLLPRKDHSAALGVGLLLLTGAGLGTYGWSLQGRLAAAERQRGALQQSLQQLRAQPAPSSALLADLQRQAERLEGEGQADPRHPLPAGPTPSQWLLRLGALSGADISLSRIDVERGGSVRLEGQAATAQSVNHLLQQWDRSQASASPVLARALDVRQEQATAPALSFKLHATAPAAPAAPPAPTTSSNKDRT